MKKINKNKKVKWKEVMCLQVKGKKPVVETCRIWNSWAIENWGLKFLNGKNSKCKDNEVGSLLLKAE